MIRCSPPTPTSDHLLAWRPRLPIHWVGTVLALGGVDIRSQSSSNSCVQVYGTPSRRKYSNLYATKYSKFYLHKFARVCGGRHPPHRRIIPRFVQTSDRFRYPNGNGSLCYCSKRRSRLDYQVADQVPRVFPWACRRDSPSPEIVRSPGYTELVV